MLWKGLEKYFFVQINEPKVETESQARKIETSFRMYFSVEKFQVIIYHDVKSERFRNQTTMENLL